MPQTNVKVELHFTRNLGNFENVKVGISVEDHLRKDESIDDATNRVYDFVSEKLVDKVKEITSELKRVK